MIIYSPLLNKYYQWYLSICKKGQERNWSRKTAPCYVEKHHIIPESLDGPTKKYNLVYLTAKEHYVVHWLLTKCYEGVARYKMIDGFWKMNKKQDQYHSSIGYSTSRKLFSERMSGDNNPSKRLEVRSILSQQKIGNQHGKNPSAKSIEQRIKNRVKNWIVTNPLGINITIQNLKKFCRDNELTFVAMLKVAQGKRTHHKKWKCSYT